MTVGKFQELYQISLMETDELTKSMLLVQCFTGLSESAIDKMNPQKFGKLCQKVVKEFDILKKKWDNSKPKNYVKANGRWYFLNYELGKGNAGKYVETATFSEDIIGNLHKILATMATPYKWTFKGLKKVEREHPDIAEDMLKLDFEVAYQAAVFFYAVFNESMRSLSTYFQREIPKEMRDQFSQVWGDFISISDGFIQPKWYQIWKESHSEKFGNYPLNNS